MKAHRTDWVSLSFGLIFLTIVIGWLASDVVTLRLASLGWVAASALILFGAIGLLGALRSNRRRDLEPVQAVAPVAAETDLPPGLHAEIMRELLIDPAARSPELSTPTARPAEPPTAAPPPEPPTVPLPPPSAPESGGSAGPERRRD